MDPDALPAGAPFPAMPLHAAQWLDDPALRGLTAEHVGALLFLLLRAWLETDGPTSRACSLPDDDAALHAWTRLPGPRWAALRGDLRRLFVTVAAPDGSRRLRYAPQFADYAAMLEKRANRQRAARTRYVVPDLFDDAAAVAPAPVPAPTPAPAPEPAPIVPPAPVPNVPLPPLPPLPSDVAPDPLRRYCAVLCATGNAALAQHTDPRRRVLVARLDSGDPRNLDAARTLVAAGVPLDYARDAVDDVARTHNARNGVSTLGYFLPAVLQRWTPEQDARLAASMQATASALGGHATGAYGTNGAHATNGSNGNGNGHGNGSGYRPAPPVSPIDRARRSGASAAAAYDLVFPPDEPSA